MTDCKLYTYPSFGGKEDVCEYIPTSEKTFPRWLIQSTGDGTNKLLQRQSRTLRDTIAEIKELVSNLSQEKAPDFWEYRFSPWYCPQATFLNSKDILLERLEQAGMNINGDFIQGIFDKEYQRLLVILDKRNV